MKNSVLRIKKYLFYLICVLSALIFMTACDDNQSKGEAYTMYYLDSAGEKLVSEEYTVVADESDMKAIILEIINQLQQNGKNGVYISPIEKEIEYDRMEFKNGQLKLFFSGAYNNKTGVREILSRAAIVKSLCGIDGVDTVEFFVEEQPLLIGGNSVGQMNDDSFVEDLGDEGEPQKRMVRLYFADSTGRKLTAIDTTVTYPAAEKIAKLLVESLIAGPEAILDTDVTGLIRTIPKGTVLNSVTIRDNICYVDLSREFAELIPNVTSDATVYSIVNTLCELPNINRVQFTIDSAVRERYGDTKGFNTAMERKLDIINDTGLEKE
ncbi:MAG: GerMN domain-containing protein [Eubacterium sp.]|nr:GerMN domain-containing protein [Eubacterium sp.]